VKDIHDQLQDLHQRVTALEAYPPNRPPKEVEKVKPVEPPKRGFFEPPPKSEEATPAERHWNPLFKKEPPVDKPVAADLTQRDQVVKPPVADLTQHDNLPPHPKE
jgi:hypothetical protein